MNLIDFSKELVSVTRLWNTLYLITPYYIYYSLVLVVLSFDYSMPLGAIYPSVFIISMLLV
jgi:hypothetical protein